MELIPIISLKNNKIIDENISVDNISQYFKEEEKIYVLDLDGIDKNKPNLCLYQKLSDSYDLWVDSGPRRLGDIVDDFMEGANSVTVRRALFPRLEIFKIKEISENKIFVNLDFKDLDALDEYDLYLLDSDGVVNLNNKEKIEREPKYIEKLKKIKTKNKIYCYEVNKENKYFWQQLNVDGLLVDVKNIKEFKNGF